MEILKQQNYLVWYPPRTRWHREDIFTIGDGLAWRLSEFKLIQWTTKHNIKARMDKIRDYLAKNKLMVCYPLQIEVWGYDKRKKSFTVEKL